MYAGQTSMQVVVGYNKYRDLVSWLSLVILADLALSQKGANLFNSCVSG